VGSDGCPLPWWGTPLEGVTGLRSCSEPYDPAMLAYGQTQYESCFSVSGPIGESMDGDNLSCCYHLDESACGNPYQGEFCIEVPYFGDGTLDALIPEGAVSFDACDAPPGPKLVLTKQSRAEHLIGVWLRCGPPAPSFNGNAIVFRGDGTFQALQTDEQGRLAPAAGCNQSGLWGFLSSNPGQLNMHMGDWTAIGSPQFTGGSPRRLYSAGNLGSEFFVEATMVP